MGTKQNKMRQKQTSGMLCALESAAIVACGRHVRTRRARCRWRRWQWRHVNRGRFIQPLWEHTSRLLQTAAVVLSITPNEHGLAQAVLSGLPYQSTTMADLATIASSVFQIIWPVFVFTTNWFRCPSNKAEEILWRRRWCNLNTIPNEI